MMKSSGSAECAAIPQKWEWHHHALSRLRDNLLQERDERRAALRATRDENAGDLADAAENEIEHGELLTELAAEDHELEEIEAALTRIRNGTYGVCEATGKPISRVRLHAVPWARCARRAAGVGWHSTLHPESQ